MCDWHGIDSKFPNFCMKSQIIMEACFQSQLFLMLTYHAWFWRAGPSVYNGRQTEGRLDRRTWPVVTWLNRRTNTVDKRADAFTPVLVPLCDPGSQHKKNTFLIMLRKLLFLATLKPVCASMRFLFTYVHLSALVFALALLFNLLPVLLKLFSLKPVLCGE